MPTVPISYNPQLVSQENNIITTPLGLTLVEIQGVLNLPKEKIDNGEYIKVDNIHDAIKFGQLSIDEATKRATLVIGVSQRLEGNIEQLEPPLAVLKVPNKSEDTKDTASPISMVDIIDKKLIFRQRPLPIM